MKIIIFIAIAVFVIVIIYNIINSGNKDSSRHAMINYVGKDSNGKKIYKMVTNPKPKDESPSSENNDSNNSINYKGEDEKGNKTYEFKS